MTNLIDQVNKIQVKSITDSLFKYGLLFFALGIIPAIFNAQLWVSILLFSFGGVFEILGLIFYCYFAIKKPDYLRSENFQIRKQSLEMLGDKDNQYNPNIKNVVYLSNPINPKEINDGDKNKSIE